MAFEETKDEPLEPLGHAESNLLFDKLKSRSKRESLCSSSQNSDGSEIECIKDSWGTDGIICNLPSELMDKCAVKSANKEKKRKGFLWFPRRSSSANNSLDSRGSSYMGPKALGLDGKPLKSCMSASNSLAGSLDDDSEGSEGHLTPKPLKRSVSFDKIHLREYERTLGDNPSVLSGPPLSIGWAHTATVALPLDDYEESKVKTKTREELQVPAPIRTLILREQAGVSSDDLRKAEEEVKNTQNQRTRTYNTLHQQGLHETVETVQRSLKRVVTRKSKQKEDVELWEKAQMGI